MEMVDASKKKKDNKDKDEKEEENIKIEEDKQKGYYACYNTSEQRTYYYDEKVYDTCYTIEELVIK